MNTENMLDSSRLTLSDAGAQKDPQSGGKAADRVYQFATVAAAVLLLISATLL